MAINHQEIEFERFMDMIENNLPNLTTLETVLAKDVAHDMTLSWEEMDVDVVNKFYGKEKEFKEALNIVQKEIIKDYNNEDICDWCEDMYNDITLVYAPDVEQIFFNIIEGKEILEVKV